jgi:hypothetical protein
MKHFKHTLETYVYSHYNICNIPINFTTSIYNTCNIPLKHLKYLKHTLTTYVFNVAPTCCLDEWRLVNAELDAAEWTPAGGQLRGPGKWLCSHRRAVVRLPSTGRAGAVPRGGGDNAMQLRCPAASIPTQGRWVAGKRRDGISRERHIRTVKEGRNGESAFIYFLWRSR